MQCLPSSVSPSHNADLRLSSHLCTSQHQNTAPNDSPSVPSTRTLQEEQEGGAVSLHPTRTFHHHFAMQHHLPQRHCVLVPFPCTQTPPALHHLLEVLNGAGAALGTMPMAPGEISLNLESGTTHYPTQQRRVCFQGGFPFLPTFIKIKGQIN